MTTEDDDDLLLSYLESACGFVEGFVGPLDDFEGDVPASVTHAIKEMVRYYYDARDPDKPSLYAAPPGVFDLISAWRKWSFGA